MKFASIFLICIVFNSVVLSQNFYSDFEDGTLQGWTNVDGFTDFMIVESSSNSNYLRKTCDGSVSAIGEMTIVNTENWIGNYFYSPSGSGGDIDMRTVDDILVRNTNNFDLYLRFAYTGSNGYQVVTTNPIVIPAQSDWALYTGDHWIDFPTIFNLTILTDTGSLPYIEIFNNVHEMFEDVVEFRILHNDMISFSGKVENGMLEIDDIMSYELLSVTDQHPPEIRLFPNPTMDKFIIQIPSIQVGSINLYTVSGKQVLRQSFHAATVQVDVSSLKEGIYFASIKTETSLESKKVLKF